MSSAPVDAGSRHLHRPSFSTSAADGTWNQSPYFVSNDMWNASGYSVTQTLYACSYSNWYITATMNNDSGDGAVKTYPNSQRRPRLPDQLAQLGDEHVRRDEPGHRDLRGRLRHLGQRARDVRVDRGDDLDPEPRPTPSGSVQGTVTFDGRSYTVWKSGSYIAFVANANFTAGTMNLLDFFRWIIGKGWMPADSTLSQVCYGAELVSTNGVPATFTFSNYSVSAS